MRGFLRGTWRRWQYRGEHRATRERDWRPALIIVAGALVVGGTVAAVSLLTR